jgi:hypothetical protein
MGSCGNSLFGKGSQYIKINGGDFIAVEGSNTVEKLITSDVRMPYKQLLKGRVILKAGQINYLLNHLGVGDNATFLSIKATYDQKSVIEMDNYISYSYYDYPVQNLTFAQMLVLTGNSSNRIPQLYLNNPNTKYPVILDVMVGVIDDSYSFFNDDVNQSGTSFTGLEYTDIKSFVVGESIAVYDKNATPRALIYIGLSYINSITLNGNFLVIDDESYGSVFLHFLTEYDARQAHSLLNYVLEHPNVDISNIIPENDDVTPVIYFNATAGTGGDYILYNDGITIGATFSTPYNTFSNGFTFSTSISLSTYGTAGIIQKSNLKDLLIDYVNDDRDGVIELMDSNLIINNSTGVVNSIGLTGSYSLKFDFADLANNNLQNVVVNLNII